jgi:hypothetical protein
VPASDNKLEVQWQEGSFTLFSYPQQHWLLLGVANIKEMEVIGSIYENPELKEQKQHA